ncbi:MAG: aminoglycoside phosphotransferase family protein [Pseudomonadota bacterium]
MPDWVWTDQVMLDATRSLLQLHDATIGFQNISDIWQIPVHEPVQVICHNDFAPYNFVFNQQNDLCGVIDFDTASPGPRAWDLAYLAYRLVPLAAPGNPDALSNSLEERKRRLALLCAAYGHQISMQELAAMVIVRLKDLAQFTDDRAKNGNSQVAAHATIYRNDAAWIEQHQSEFA